MYGEKKNKANKTFSYTGSVNEHFGLATKKESTHPHTCPSAEQAAHDIKVNTMQEVL